MFNLARNSLQASLFFLFIFYIPISNANVISHRSMANTAVNQSFETQHSIKIDGQNIKYTADVGVLPIYDKQHSLMAKMSYFSYTKSGDTDRPITFIWQGGPGDASLVSNFLVSGPKIYDSKIDKIVVNQTTWLRFTDLVYIDMVGTGWGRSLNDKSSKSIYTPEGDAKTFSDFIQNYLIKTHSLGRKIYLSGISYGGYRLPLVAIDLAKNMLSVKGMVLQSPELKRDYHINSYANIYPYIMGLPTQIRAALHYHKLSADFQRNPKKTIYDGTKWALHDYPALLFQGDNLSKVQAHMLLNKLHDYTGLPKVLIKNNHYRIPMELFMDKLVNDTNKQIDYTDYSLTDEKLVSFYDVFPLTMKSFLKTTMYPYPKIMQYVNRNLKVNFKSRYINYFDPQALWSWGTDSPFEAISKLRDSLLINNNAKLFVGAGYYDTDVPYMMTTIAINQLQLPPSIRKDVSVHYYNGGHMFSASPTVRPKFNNDIRYFYSKK